MVIAPGVVKTELLSHTTSQKLIEEHERARQGKNNILEPEDIANTVLFVYQQPQNINIREVVLAPTSQQK